MLSALDVPRLVLPETAKSYPLLELLRTLAVSQYQFTTTTPRTHQHYYATRAAEGGASLRDIFGWNLPFTANAISKSLLSLMTEADIVRAHDKGLQSTVRVATLGDQFFLHSAYPTTDPAAVFFGPDTYRFVRFISQSLQHTTHGVDAKPMRILDIGCGSGAGGIFSARYLAELGIAAHVAMNDINPLALHYTAINAQAAEVQITSALGDALSAVSGEFDLIISNPPYLDDAAQRAYRHGGARLGRALSVRIATEALGRLAPGGKLLLYTGVAMVNGVDPFFTELLPLLAASNCDWWYEEIDPDIFGEELERPIYTHVERIAAVGLIAARKP